MAKVMEGQDSLDFAFGLSMKTRLLLKLIKELMLAPVVVVLEQQPRSTTARESRAQWMDSKWTGMKQIPTSNNNTNREDNKERYRMRIPREDEQQDEG